MSGDHHDDIEPTPVIMTPELAARGLGNMLAKNMVLEGQLTRDAVKAVIDEMARLRAESRVLASVVEALEDPDHPEESPVEAVRRLRAEVERLDMLNKVEAGVRVRAQAEVERLTRERDALIEEYLDPDDDNDALVKALREHWERCVVDESRPALVRLVDFVRGWTGHYRVAWMATMAEDEAARLRERAETAEHARDAAMARSASDGRVIVKMGIRNREMMAEVGEHLSTIAGLEVSLELSTQAEADDAATIGRLTRERDDEKQLRVGIVEAFAAPCPRCGFPGGDQ